MGNIIKTRPLHSDDLRRVTALMVEERLLRNQTTHEDLEVTVLELVHLFADRFRAQFTADQYEALKAVTAQQVQGSTRQFHRREKNTLQYRAFWMDKWAEPSQFALRYWFPLKAKLGWNQWMNPINPLKTLIRTDDSLFMLDEYDAWNFAGDQIAQLLFGFLDNVKNGKINDWDEEKLRSNCFGDDMIAGGNIAAPAAKTIRDILLPEEKKKQLLQEMRQYIEEKLEQYDLTIRDVVIQKLEHQGRWIKELSEEVCAVELEGALRKPEIVSGYFSILQKEGFRSPIAVDWSFAQQAIFRFGGIAFTSTAYHIINRTGILRKIEDESFLAFVAALIGGGSARVAHKDRDKREHQYPEEFSRINPFSLWLLECKVARLRKREMKRRAKETRKYARLRERVMQRRAAAALSANAKMNTEK